jgi:hypothetical protein
MEFEGVLTGAPTYRGGIDDLRLTKSHEKPGVTT